VFVEATVRELPLRGPRTAGWATVGGCRRAFLYAKKMYSITVINFNGRQVVRRAASGPSRRRDGLWNPLTAADL